MRSALGALTCVCVATCVMSIRERVLSADARGRAHKYDLRPASAPGQNASTSNLELQATGDAAYDAQVRSHTQQGGGCPCVCVCV